MNIPEFFLGNPRERASQQILRTLSKEGNLNARKERQKKAARADLKGLYIRRGVSLLVACGVGIGIFLSVRPSEQSTDLDWLTIEGNRIASDSQISEVKRAAKEWDDVYSCGRLVRVRFMERITSNFDGLPRDIPESAEPGLINLARQGNKRDDVLHGLTHACKPDEPTWIPPIVIDNGDEVKGYHGLTLKIRTKNGRETLFTAFEEGVAEKNASLFPTYRSPGRRYKNILDLTLGKFMFGGNTNLMDLVKSNNVPVFVRKFLGFSETHQLTGADFTEAMAIYAETYFR